MRLRQLKGTFTLPTNLSFGAMNQGMYIEFVDHTTPGVTNVLNLCTVDTYPSVPLYIKNTSSTSPLVINANQDEDEETIEGSASLRLNPGEYTILQGIRDLNTNINYWTSEKSEVGARPYLSLAILPSISEPGGIYQVDENNTGEDFTLTNSGTGSYSLNCTTNSTFFSNKRNAVYVSGRRFAVVDGGTPDSIDVKVYDPTDTLADFGSGSTHISQVEFRFYPA